MLNCFSFIFSKCIHVGKKKSLLSFFCLPPDLYCTLEVDSYGYFVSKAKTRVFRDTTEPQWNEVGGPLNTLLLHASALRDGIPLILPSPVSLRLPDRSSKSSWRAPSTCASCATRSVTTKACSTRTTTRLWTRSWGRGRSR